MNSSQQRDLLQPPGQGWTHLDGGVPLARRRGPAHVAPEVPGLREFVFLLWHLHPGILGLL